MIKYTTKEEALEVVRENGYALEYASKELRNDKEVVSHSLQNVKS